MNLILRIIVVLLGLLLLLPGLCTVLFGGWFALGSLSGGGDLYGIGKLSIPWLIAGGLLTWGGWALLAGVARGARVPPDSTRGGDLDRLAEEAEERKDSDAP